MKVVAGAGGYSEFVQKAETISTESGAKILERKHKDNLILVLILRSRHPSLVLSGMSQFNPEQLYVMASPPPGAPGFAACVGIIMASFGSIFSDLI